MVHMFKLIYIKKFYKVCIGLQGLNQSGVPWTPRLCASIWRGRRGTCCSARGVMYALASLWRPSGVPWAPRLCASIWRGRRGTCYSARGVMYALASLWRPSGVPWAPRLCASIWRGRRGTCCSGRGVMYALASLWRPSASLGLRCFYLAWQARDLLLCKGRDVRPGVTQSLTHTHSL